MLALSIHQIHVAVYLTQMLDLPRYSKEHLDLLLTFIIIQGRDQTVCMPCANSFNCCRKADHSLEDAFLVGLQVQSSSHVIGSTVALSGLRGLDGLYLTSVKRGETITHAVSPDFVLLQDDILFFAGDLPKVISLARRFRLKHVSDAFEEDIPAVMGNPTALRSQAIMPFSTNNDEIPVRSSAAFMSIHP
jgi:hypothetical protein